MDFLEYMVLHLMYAFRIISSLEDLFFKTFTSYSCFVGSYSRFILEEGPRRLSHHHSTTFLALCTFSFSLESLFYSIHYFPLPLIAHVFLESTSYVPEFCIPFLMVICSISTLYSPHLRIWLNIFHSIYCISPH